MKAKTISGLASAIGLISLVGLVSAASAIFSYAHASPQDQSFGVLAIIGNLIAVPTALAAWNGILWKKGKETIKGPTTPLEWIVTFFCATFLSIIFVAIDFAIKKPGLSFVFTIGAITLSFVALPSALRVWISEHLSRRYGELEE